MPERDDWVALNGELGEVCNEMVAELPTTGPTDSLVVDILSGFMRKAGRLLKATNVLARDGLWDEIQGLARVLFELRVKTDYFLKMLREDGEIACQTVMDAWLLQRIKEFETSEWYGAAPEVKEAFRPKIRDMEERLSPERIRQLRRHGFPGISLEACSDELGHGRAYQIIYRRFGRAIHSSDYVEFMAGPNREEEARYYEWRDPLIAYVVHFSAGGIAELANFFILDRRYDRPLDDIGQRSRELRGLLEKHQPYLLAGC